jgi:hypothetical protein
MERSGEMIRAGKPNANGVLPVVLEGALSKAEFAQALEKIGGHAREQADLRLLVRVNEIAGVEPAAIWEEFDFDPTWAERFEKVAVIAAEPGMEWGMKLSEPFTSAETKVFAPGDEKAAEDWANA